MRRIDEIHTSHPTWGYRTITRILRRDDNLLINRKKVRRIMREIGIYTIFPKPNFSKRYHAKYVRPQKKPDHRSPLAFTIFQDFP